MLRPNGVVSAELADEAAVGRLLAATRLWTAATSFGGVHSTVDRRAQWGGDAVAPGFVRLSCGIEDTDDLVDRPGRRARRSRTELRRARAPVTVNHTLSAT